MYNCQEIIYILPPPPPPHTHACSHVRWPRSSHPRKTIENQVTLTQWELAPDHDMKHGLCGKDIEGQLWDHWHFIKEFILSAWGFPRKKKYSPPLQSRHAAEKPPDQLFTSLNLSYNLPEVFQAPSLLLTGWRTQRKSCLAPHLA